MVNKITQKHKDFPEVLLCIPDAPKELFILGQDLSDLLQKPCLAVVGSRALTPYGRAAINTILPEVIRAGVVIVSGLALGTDAAAHQAALEQGGKTIAVLPTSVEEIYPATNRQLARNILETGGALISEYPKGTPGHRGNFIARNRLVSGLSKAVLITEAAERSGTLHTAQFALEQGKDVMAVPGNITSPTSAGTNNLIKSGATPVTTAADILHVLGLAQGQKVQQAFSFSSEEQAIVTLLQQGISHTSQLLLESKLDATVFNQTLTMLEITGRIKPVGTGHWTLH